MTKETTASRIVNMLGATSTLSRLVPELETGGADEFVIARNGWPVARLVPLVAAQADRSRRNGVAGGRFKVPDDIDKLDVDVAKLLGGD
jgi:antitoxin (DNA-binding transcriptional repressor) of toxin-antitoxin stability system